MYKDFYFCEVKMKNAQTEITTTTVPECMTYNDFAKLANRHRSHISYAVNDGQLNWGKCSGKLMIVLDNFSAAFLKKCKALDISKKVRE